MKSTCHSWNERQSAVRSSACWRIEGWVFFLLLIVALSPAQSAFAQGCGMGGHGGHGGGQAASHDRASASSGVMPVWNSILFSRAGLDRAVSEMSVPDAVYYGGLLRDDFKSLKTNARDMSLGMDMPLASTNDRVKQLTKQIPRDLKANDQAAALRAFGNLETEIERAVALFPSTAFPEGFAAKFRPSDSLGAEEAIETADIAVPAEKYVCPMHPEVTANKPGDCPKCGMALKQI